MSKTRRTFTQEDRYSIVQESLRDGHSETCRKCNRFGAPIISFPVAKVAKPLFEQG